MRKWALLPLIVLFCVTPLIADKTVTIESARSTEYIKSSEEDESDKKEIIRFRGDVHIVIVDGNSISRISADEILYDKIRETIEAYGSVIYEHKTGSSGSEKFTGKALKFNIKSQEGVFLSGAVTQDTGKKSSDPYIVQAEVTGRDTSSTMAFKNGVLTTCDADDPHWSINASRIWLLPGNEIAILNGVFFIGPLPIFYIPAFYYPSDEMIVHPVYGFRNREGYFVQTTTYLLGRKPLPVKSGTSSGTSFSDFLQGDSLKEQKREGLFLKNLDEDAKQTSSDYLKLMVDGYSTLGFMAGLDGDFSRTGYIKSIKFSVMTGFSQTLFPPDSGLFYSSYSKDGSQFSDSGWLFETKLPFRYRTTFSITVDKKPFKLSASLPLISDPSFKKDFMDRSEDLNWFTLLTEQDKLAKGSSLSEESSFSWNIHGSINPDVSFAAPYLNKCIISGISGLLTFNSKTNDQIPKDNALYSPERKFFYPELIKPEIRLSLGGTLLSSTKSTQNTTPKASNRINTGDLENPFIQDANNTIPADEDIDAFFPNATTGIKPDVQRTALPSWSLTWSLDPSFLEEIRYYSTVWKSPSDIYWDSYSSVYNQGRTTGTIQGSWAYDQNFLSLSSSLNFSGTVQDHPWLSPVVYDTENKISTVILADLKATSFSIGNANSITLVPFNRNEIFKPNSLSWKLSNKLVQSEFSGTVEDPHWDKNTFKWTKEHVSVHSATATTGFKIGGYEQKFTLVSNLLPLLESWAGVASFGMFFLSATFSSKLYEKENSASRWFWDPFNANLTWKLPFSINFSQAFVYDIEEKTPSRLHMVLSRNQFSAFYTMTHTVPFMLVEGSGWVLDGTEKSFIPTATGFSFSNASKPLTFYVWKNRFFLNAKIASNLKFNLLKLTESSFDFEPSVTLKIHQFLDLTFSSTSRNDVIARYFQDWMDLPAPLPGETSITKDLIKSFNFFDETDRTTTGFKLKRLSMDLTHYLHDWTANLKISVKPELNKTGIYQYEFKPSITFMVQWKPISDIKTTVKSEKGVFTLNTTDSEVK